MTLEELSAEYTAGADALLEMIRANQTRMRIASRQGDRDRVVCLQRRLVDLRCQREHVLDIAHRLKTYYDRTTDRIE